MLAIFPRVSRSGITISAALALGMDRESSVRFSFLLSAPIIFAAFCYSMKELAGISGCLPITAILAGFLAAFASGISAIHFLLKFVRQRRFTPFVIYRLAASVIVLIIIIYKG